MLREPVARDGDFAGEKVEARRDFEEFAAWRRNGIHRSSGCGFDPAGDESRRSSMAEHCYKPGPRVPAARVSSVVKACVTSMAERRCEELRRLRVRFSLADLG
jgi:hypothetical protein